MTKKKPVIFILLSLIIFVPKLFSDLGVIPITIDKTPRTWEKLNSELYAIKSLDQAHQYVEKKLTKESPTDQDIALAYYDFVINRFYHCPAHHNYPSNPIAWGLGLFYDGFTQIRNPETMIKKTRCLQCGQSSFLLRALLNQKNIKTRHVGLHGHVVLEAWYNGKWHLFDTDYEVTPRKTPSDEILSYEEMVKDPELLKSLYSGLRSNMQETLFSIENTNYVAYPPQAWFNWSSTLLAKVEMVLDPLNYVLALCFFLFGIRKLKHDK